MSNLSNFINTGGGSGGINEIEIKTSEMFMDEVLTNVDAGTIFDVYDCYNFSPAGPGAVWFNFLFPDGFDPAKDIRFDISYSLSGNDDLKQVRLKTEIWVNAIMSIPNPSSPTLDTEENIISHIYPGIAANIGVVAYATLVAKISEVQLSGSTNKIAVKFTRETAHIDDTYTGTFQLMSFKIRQVTP